VTRSATAEGSSATGETSSASTEGSNTTDGVASAGNVSAESHEADGSNAQSSPDNADNNASVAGEPGVATAAAQGPAENAVESGTTQTAATTAAPGETAAVAASPETATAAAPSETAVNGVQNDAAAQQATEADPGGFSSPGDPAADNAVDEAAAASAAQVAEEDPDGYSFPGDPVVDRLVDEAAAAPQGRQYVAGFDVAVAGEGFGVRLGYQTDPPAIVAMVRGWAGYGLQAYGLSMPAEKPGAESLTLFAQAQRALGPFVGGVEAAISPFKSEDEQKSISLYGAAQIPQKDLTVPNGTPEGRPVGAGWVMGSQSHNPVTGKTSELQGVRGVGVGGMNGVAVGIRGVVGVSPSTAAPIGVTDLSGQVP
jgi:hypothetical protein